MIRALGCPHCGKIDWSRAPRLCGVLEYLELRGEITSREVADHFRIKIANAANQMAMLQRLGLATKVRTEPGSAGGIEHFYRPVPGAHSGLGTPAVAEGKRNAVATEPENTKGDPKRLVAQHEDSQ